MHTPMTRHQHYTEQTSQWIDILTERAGTLVQFSPALRLRYAVAELAEQVANLKREARRHECASAEEAPRYARRMEALKREIADLRRFVAVGADVDDVR